MVGQWTTLTSPSRHDDFSAQHGGLIDEEVFIVAGPAAREDTEMHTDVQLSPAIAALGDEIDELFAMQPWGAAVRTGRGYLPSGPTTLRRP